MARPRRSKYPLLLTTGRYRYFDEGVTCVMYYWCRPDSEFDSPFGLGAPRGGVLDLKLEHFAGLAVCALLSAHLEWVREDQPRFADPGFFDHYEITRRMARFAVHPIDEDDLPNREFFRALYNAGIIDLSGELDVERKRHGIRISRECLSLVMLFTYEIIADGPEEAE